MKAFLEKFLNLFMFAERNIYLNSNIDDKANGYYDRNLATSNGNFDLSVPRVRSGNFRPNILPEPY